MKKLLSALALSVAAANAACGVGDPPEYEHVILISDSLMSSPVGKPVDYCPTVPHRLQAEYPPLRVTNLGVPGGALVDAWAYRLDNAVRFLTAHPVKTAVWIQVGVNDYGRSVPLATFKQNYKNLLYGLSLNKNKPDVYCVLPTINRFDAQYRVNGQNALMVNYRLEIRRIANTWKDACKMVDTGPWFSMVDASNTSLTPDGLHFTERAHTRYLSKMTATLYIN